MEIKEKETMIKSSKIFTSIAMFALCFLMASCSWYVRYPSIGVKPDRVRATNWSGETRQRCCYVALDIDTGMKEYHCQDLFPAQCTELLKGVIHEEN